MLLAGVFNPCTGILDRTTCCCHKEQDYYLSVLMSINSSFNSSSPVPAAEPHPYSMRQLPPYVSNSGVRSHDFSPIIVRFGNRRALDRFWEWQGASIDRFILCIWLPEKKASIMDVTLINRSMEHYKHVLTRGMKLLVLQDRTIKQIQMFVKLYCNNYTRLLNISSRTTPTE